MSSLGHMCGGTDLSKITDPKKLPVIDYFEINKHISRYNDYRFHTTQTDQGVFSYYSILITGSFVYKNKTIYLIIWKHEMFLAEINNGIIQIVNPLFNQQMYYMYGIKSTSYNNMILINWLNENYIDDYERGFREPWCIIIKGNKLIKFNWFQKNN